LPQLSKGWGSLFDADSQMKMGWFNILGRWGSQKFFENTVSDLNEGQCFGSGILENIFSKIGKGV
jgi:hypothetical protein